MKNTRIVLFNKISSSCNGLSKDLLEDILLKKHYLQYYWFYTFMMVNGIIDNINTITYIKTKDKTLHIQIEVEDEYDLVYELLVSDELKKYFKRNLHSTIDTEPQDDHATFYIMISDK